MNSPDSRDIYQLHRFVADFARWNREGYDIRYCFVVGSGASRSSGIPTGATLVDDWLHERFEQDCPGEPRDKIQPWAEETLSKTWSDFTWANRAEFYGRIYEWSFLDNAMGQAALRKLIREKPPSFGYSVFANILENTAHKVVLTTNFDNLVREAMSLYVSNANPFVCYGEADARFLAGHANRVRIVKIHGDIDRQTYNAADQIENLHRDWDRELRAIFTDHTPIFLGYGGNDPGFMRFLYETLNENQLQFRARPIWTYRVDPDAVAKSGTDQLVPPGWPTGKLVHNFMQKHGGLWLPIPGFDEFMLLLGHTLSYENQAGRIRGDADRRAQDYERTLIDAVRALRSTAYSSWCPQLRHLTAAAELHLLGKVERRGWEEWRVAIEAAPSREEKASLLDNALKELQDSPELKAYSASFVAEETPNAPIVDQRIQEALVQAEKSFGQDSPTMLSVLHQKARIYAIRGQAKESANIAMRVLQLRTTVLGSEHPDTLRTANLAAAALSDLGNYAEAEELHRRALEARERTLGPEHPDTLRSISNLADTIASQGKYAEAEELHRRALEAYKRALGPEHRNTLACVNDLANTLAARGEYAEAEELYRRTMKEYEGALGLEHPDTLRSISNLSNTMAAQGKYVEAEKLHRRALEAYKRALGPEHRNTLACINNLAKTLSSQGKYAEAEELHRRALEARERIMGLEYTDTLWSVSNLADTLSAQGKSEEAENLYHRAVSGFTKTFGPNHPYAIVAHKKLAKLTEAKARKEEAI